MKMAITAARGEDHIRELDYFVRPSSMPNLQTFKREDLGELRSSAPVEFCQAIKVPFLVKEGGEMETFELSTILRVAELDQTTPVEAHGALITNEKACSLIKYT